MSNDVLFNVGHLFNLAFGIQPPAMLPFTLQVQRVEQPTFNLPGAPAAFPVTYSPGEIPDTTKRGRKSQFGFNLLFPLQFVGETYKRFDNKGVLRSVEMEPFCLPATTMVDFSREKILTETPQTASEGPVVEMYGFESWDIRMRGLCLNDPAHPQAKTAEEQKEALLKWESLASGVYVSGRIFTEKNIYFIAIKSIRFSQIEGRPFAVPFEIEAISLVPPEEQVL